ncbi:MAG: type IV secretion system protein [Limnobacter sp.]|uniref:type IV secretion system protein n=1 Tax=Limnobacter sp. TaxID=2003368 RepID=UPI0032EB854F
MASSNFRLFFLPIFGLAILFLWAPGDAFAQSAGADFSNSIGALVDDMFTRTSALGLDINQRVAPLASKMLLYLTAIMIVYNASIFLLKDGSINEFFVQFFVLIITYHLAKFLGTPEVSSAIRNFFDTLSGLVNPALDGSSPANFVVGEFRNIFSPIQILLDSDLWTESNFLIEPAKVLALVASLGIMFFAGIFAGVVLVLNFLTSEVMFFFAIGLAPIFAYSLAVPYLSFLFDAWLRFVLAACGFKVILAGVSTLSSVVSGRISDFSNMPNAGADFSSLSPLLAITAVFTILIGAIYILVPILTNQLFGAGSRLSVGSGISSMGRAAGGLRKPFGR